MSRITPAPTTAVQDELLTGRLVLRRPRVSDGPVLHASVMASLPELRAWMAWAAVPLDVEGYTENLRRAAERFDERAEFRYLMFDRVSGALVGSTGFHALDWRIPKGEIGYWVDARYAGRGYVTEAVAALVAYGFERLGFRRIEIRCDTLNERSRRVAERLGFTLDARLVNDDVSAADPAVLRDTLCIRSCDEARPCDRDLVLGVSLFEGAAQRFHWPMRRASSS